MKFAKYHGCGNNFIITKESDIPVTDFSALAKKVCDPNIGIGADGFIAVRETPSLEMIFYNKDGSRAPMCGNGIRCFAHFCKDNGIRTENSFAVDTLAGQMKVDIKSTDPFLVKINMGKPDFDPHTIGVTSDGPFIDKTVCNTLLSSFFMGTVHTVVWVDDLTDFERLGEKISNDETFKEKTNVNFAKILDKDTAYVRTYERGVGVTCACGTGACAVAVLGKLQGKFTDAVEIRLPYGSLHIEEDSSGNVFMTGPSIRTCSGEYDIGGIKND